MTLSTPRPRPKVLALLAVALLALPALALAPVEAGPAAAGAGVVSADFSRDLQLETLKLKLPDGHVVALPADHGQPPVPAYSRGIGPGSQLLIDIPDAGTFQCTANFVWRDTAGNLYLGAAGHCFLPETKKTTHGPGTDYNAAGVKVSVCYDSCRAGGQLGFIVSGLMKRLGPVVYARQTGPGGDLGNDFGLVRIPNDPEILKHVRPEMPVWGGPHREGDLVPTAPVVHYGNAVAFGEVYPTKGRAGIGLGVSEDNSYWFALAPSMQGDSGAAVITGKLTFDGSTLEGDRAVGVLTHLVVGLHGPVAGTTLARAKVMALEAGLTITPLLAGDDL